MDFIKKKTSVALIALALAAPVMADDDMATKLQELEKAMRSSSAETANPDAAVKKIRKRAIVFEADDSAAASAPTQQAKQQDCSRIPLDIKTEPIDFPVQFKLGSADIAPSSESLLLQIGKILSLSPDKCVLVEGHTDSTGNAEKNLILSRDRAAAVVKYLSERSGVSAPRLVPIGKGSNDPLKNLDPRDGKNRRVVFKVVSG